MKIVSSRFLSIAVLILLAVAPAQAAVLHETPSLEAAVKQGTLPPVAQRIPESPLVVQFDGQSMRPGRRSR